MKIISALVLLLILAACDNSPSLLDHGKYNVLLTCRVNASILDEDTRTRCLKLQTEFDKAKVEYTKKRLSKYRQ